ncbi:MAG: hypothetical protein O0X96_05715 [Methanocorpusculum sp.]|nr:hypothetical protein [Methanocorpusculum sp.]MDE2524608.1 hypothetical protein [Methanocorpusculum sp.]
MLELIRAELRNSEYPGCDPEFIMPNAGQTFWWHQQNGRLLGAAGKWRKGGREEVILEDGRSSIGTVAGMIIYRPVNAVGRIIPGKGIDTIITGTRKKRGGFRASRSRS